MENIAPIIPIVPIKIDGKQYVAKLVTKDVTTIDNKKYTSFEIQGLESISPPASSFSAVVDDKGRIVIDACVRKQKGIKAGDRVRVIELEKV